MYLSEKNNFSFKAEEVLKMKPDGIFISNGPGDPSAVPYIVEEIKKLQEQYPALKQAMLPMKEIELVPNREENVFVLEESDREPDPLDAD
jgi:hypothetical protein